eukprot:CAMPEP_0198120928 /NCGR_PEP_ID=MMETSP1442-20131203/30720_1 /TAXON_ID= /ORGANISM="Craspedostauros australis, Strain CCMP3328" /LENGTH=38 /DNA_ID= /DNA_START= /DNA_END= /DNA_ORIENTATION=
MDQQQTTLREILAAGTATAGLTPTDPTPPPAPQQIASS